MDSAKALVELQDVDMNVFRDQQALKSMPVAAKIADIRSRLKELSRRTTRINGLVKDNDMTIADLTKEREEIVRRAAVITEENKTADFRQVSTNNAILDNLTKRLEKNEYNLGKAQIEAKRLQGLLEQSNQIRGSLEARERELLVQLRNDAAPIREEIAQLMGQRESLLASIDPELLEAYQNSCTAHGRIGISVLEGGCCSGCRMQLQPSQIDELRAGPDIATCPVCGRLLVVRTQKD